MTSRRTTPTTPFIPPFGSPKSSNGDTAPVVPGGLGGHSPSWNQPQTIGGYPTMSPYLNGPPPFIPSFSPGAATPGVIPSALPISQSSSRGSSRQGLSQDYTGYPQGTPATSLANFNMYGAATATPAPGPTPTISPHNPYASQPNSPWFAPPPNIAWGGTPFAPNSTPLPGTPWPSGGPPPLVPAGPAGHYVPFGMPPMSAPTMSAPAWGAAGMYTMPMSGVPLPQTGGRPATGAATGIAASAAADPWAAFYGTPAAAPPSRPAPPAQAHDRLDPFLAGKHCTFLCPFVV